MECSRPRPRPATLPRPTNTDKTKIAGVGAHVLTEQGRAAHATRSTRRHHPLAATTAGATSRLARAAMRACGAAAASPAPVTTRAGAAASLGREKGTPTQQRRLARWAASAAAAGAAQTTQPTATATATRTASGLGRGGVSGGGGGGGGSSRRGFAKDWGKSINHNHNRANRLVPHADLGSGFGFGSAPLSPLFDTNLGPHTLVLGIETSCDDTGAAVGHGRYCLPRHPTIFSHHSTNVAGHIVGSHSSQETMVQNSCW